MCRPRPGGGEQVWLSDERHAVMMALAGGFLNPFHGVGFGALGPNGVEGRRPSLASSLEWHSLEIGVISRRPASNLAFSLPVPRGSLFLLAIMELTEGEARVDSVDRIHEGTSKNPFPDAVWV